MSRCLLLVFLSGCLAAPQGSPAGTQERPAPVDGGVDGVDGGAESLLGTYDITWADSGEISGSPCLSGPAIAADRLIVYDASVIYRSVSCPEAADAMVWISWWPEEDSFTADPGTRLDGCAGYGFYEVLAVHDITFEAGELSARVSTIRYRASDDGIDCGGIYSLTGVRE